MFLVEKFPGFTEMPRFSRKPARERFGLLERLLLLSAHPRDIEEEEL